MEFKICIDDKYDLKLKFCRQYNDASGSNYDTVDLVCQRYVQAFGKI